MAALNRIRITTISPLNGHVTESGFSPIDPPPPGDSQITYGTGYYSIDGKDVRFVHGLTTNSLKSELEQVMPPAESKLGLFRRPALQSTNPVEQFMHLYYILLMYFDDKRSPRRGLTTLFKVNPQVR